MERFSGVLGKKRVAAITNALESCGATILSAPAPDVAPFEFVVRSREGEPLDLVCYAFSANKYRQAGRPSDEHRMQVKYGGDFTRYHQLFIDPTRRRVTLMFGVHEEDGLFVAVDPAMHNPTWFSRSIEFKDEHVAQVLKSGWHGWERERTAARRKKLMPLDDCRTEVLLGFKPEHFIRYARLEKVASGLDAGERLRLIDRIEEAPKTGLPKVIPPPHPLELQLGLSAEQILNVLGAHHRLLVAVRGGVAEHHLGAHLRSITELKNVRMLDEDGRPDFEVTYSKRQFLIECKNVGRRATASRPRVDFQKTRAAKGDPCSRYYRRDQFNLLAACLHPVTENWDYSFVRTRVLPSHKTCNERLATKIEVGGPDWTSSIVEALELELRDGSFP